MDYISGPLKTRLMNFIDEVLLKVLPRAEVAKQGKSWWVFNHGRRFWEIFHFENRGPPRLRIVHLFEEAEDENWPLIYDFLEFMLTYAEFPDKEYKRQAIELLNVQLEMGGSGWKWDGTRFVEVLEPLERESIESALNDDDEFVRTHLAAALDRLGPGASVEDYRDSIHQSITAVERACRVATGEKREGLGGYLEILKQRNIGAHRLLESCAGMYGWSNENGVRHSLEKSQNLTRADALFFLVSCSAFISYLRSSI